MHAHQAILIIKAGTKLTSLQHTDGDYEHWVMSAMAMQADRFVVVSVADGQALPQVGSVKAVVITGSAAMVTDTFDWIERSAQWLRQLPGRQIPVLGICFGHQLLAHAFGGAVMDNPRGVEVGTVTMHLSSAAASDPLFAGASDMLVQTSHRQVVTRLPPAAIRLATTAMDANHAFRYADSIWGVQFHPEFDAAITRKYIEYFQQDLVEAGIDPAHTMQACQQTTAANKILRRFSELSGT